MEPSPPALALCLAAQALLLVGLFAATRSILRLPAAARPELGERGVCRRQALLASSGFASFEPLLRWLAALLSPLASAAVRQRLQRLITRSGCWLGLSPEEAFALCTVSAAGALALLWLVPAALPVPIVVVLLGLGSGYPLLKLHGMAKERGRVIARRLPVAIDLLSLCMGAGMDFIGALELFVREHSRESDPLVHELRRVLQELSLGRTRREALQAFADRCPLEAVTEFAAALIQAEQKGTPLSQILNLQAQMLRMRRSVAAEEAAARASLLLLFPMVLLMGCVLLILMGPFIVSGVAL